jgi:uncharacterized protein YhbP (UPF0306 family)
MTDVPQPVLDYLDAEKTVTVATASADGVPRARTFMYVHDGLSIYFWVRTSSATARHLRSNPRVSFTIDEYVEDWNKAKGIQGEGECVPVTEGDDIANAVGMFAEKFPAPSSGASTTNISFYKITPRSLQFIDNAGAQTTVASEEFGMNFHLEDVVFSD